MSRWGVVSPLDTLLCSSHVLKFSTILRNGPLMPVTGVLLESRDQITSKCVICCCCCNKNCIDYSYTFQTTTATTSSSSLTALSSYCLKITQKVSFFEILRATTFLSEINDKTLIQNTFALRIEIRIFLVIFKHCEHQKICTKIQEFSKPSKSHKTEIEFWHENSNF